MALIVDIRHWLDENGNIPDDPRIRRQALRVARLIEAGGPLKAGESRETLVECSCRPDRKQCLGLMWVEKCDEEHIHAECLVCLKDQVQISGWQDTEWANGMMDPVSPDDRPTGALLN